MLDWEWFSVPEMVQVFLYLLLNANSEDKKWRGETVKRGWLVTSNARMRQDLRLSEQQIRTIIKRLISTGEITYKSTNRYVIITICNYDKYQGNKNQINEQINEQSTSNQRQLKNIRNKEYNIIDINLRGSNDQLSSAFDEAEASEPNEKIPFAEIKELWNATCTGFPRLVVISENRRNKLRNRVAEMGGYAKAIRLLKKIFEKMQQSKFLKGDNKRGWKASFDWLIENDKNWAKVFEGNYDNKPEQLNTRFTNNRNCNDEWE